LVKVVTARADQLSHVAVVVVVVLAVDRADIEAAKMLAVVAEMPQHQVAEQPDQRVQMVVV
jgi:hypothetical protein